MTWQELKTEICRRLNIDYEEIRAGTNDLFKWDDLESWGNTAIHRAWDYHDWPFPRKPIPRPPRPQQPIKGSIMIIRRISSPTPLNYWRLKMKTATSKFMSR